VDMRCLTPLDVDSVARSIDKTGRLLVADCAPEMASMAHKLMSELFQSYDQRLQQAPCLIVYPNHPVPTSHFMANHYYPGAEQIAAAVLDMLDKPQLQAIVNSELQSDLAKDQPDRSFVGPF
jgi:acetoin:2,6-dichlorophenolindophenol oxidoreductase subunit beta